MQYSRHALGGPVVPSLGLGIAEALGHGRYGEIAKSQRREGLTGAITRTLPSYGHWLIRKNMAGRG